MSVSHLPLSAALSGWRAASRLPDAARARLAVRTLRGALVSDRMPGVRDGETLWDARDASGRGVYVVRLSVPGSAARFAERTITLTR